MKEVTIVVEIGHDGEISADAEGFTDGACMRDLERLLEGLAEENATIQRKPDQPQRRTKRRQTQRMEKKR